jgi:hypothetical protein
MPNQSLVLALVPRARSLLAEQGNFCTQSSTWGQCTVQGINAWFQVIWLMLVAVV